MPAKGQYRPGSRLSTLREWYRANPGFHRCKDVAAALDLTTHAVASDSKYLETHGDIQRRRTSQIGRSLPITEYGIEAE